MPRDNHQRQADPSWLQLGSRYWPQYVATAALFVLLEVVDPWEPVPRFIYHKSDAEYWRYSRPHMPDAVPIWLVPLLSLLLPAVVVLGAHVAGRAPRLEAHHACLMLLTCVALTGLVSNLLKSQVARPRPDFMARCWPSGGEPVWAPDGAPRCEKGVPHRVIKTGMRSFPSVHASWTAAGLGFLSLWLMGAMRCFAGLPAGPAQLVLALCPLGLAAWVGIRRLQIYRHHPGDVVGAQLLGLFFAWACYRQAFASPFSADAGRLNEEVYAERAEHDPDLGAAAAGHASRAGAPAEPLLP